MEGFLIVAVLVSVFLLGAKVGSETTESDMYHRDYKSCIEALPRNKDCEAVGVVFSIVDKNN